MINTVTLSFCSLQIYNNIVVSIINEGIVLTQDLIDEMVETIVPSFKGEDFVYITHRINSYSVDPTIYISVSKIKNLVGFAVVSTNHMALSSTDIERLFLKKPFEVFSELDKSIQWANKLLKKKQTIKEC
jgi:hypothetical protein